MTEKELQSNVLKLARTMGWKAYHTFDSRRSNPGFPDLVLVHTGQRRVLFRELKGEGGRATLEQAFWISDLLEAGQDAGYWMPNDWHGGRIESELREDLQHELEGEE